MACDTIVGKATNARPIPEVATPATSVPCACAMNPRAAKTPMPARISKPEFAKATTSPEPVRSVLRLRYEEYVTMMPKATDSEKKMCPYADAQTPGSASASQFGVKKALRPSIAPGRNSACTTRTANMSVSSGIRIMFALPMPRFTPSAMMPITTTHTPISGMPTPGTKSVETPTSATSADLRKSTKKKLSSLPAPHVSCAENQVYIAAQATMTA